jgi:hypothetical protein
MAVRITLNNLLLLSGFIAMGSLASASPVNINCAGPGANQVTVPDVTALAPDTCSVLGSDFVFSNFGVSSTASSTPQIGIAGPNDGTGVVGADTNLVFQLSNEDTGLDDTYLNYKATGSTVGLDLNFEASPLAAEASGSATITEVACSIAFVSRACSGTTYADFSATSICVSSVCTDASSAALLAGGAQNPVYIQSDIAFNGVTVPQFENSHFAAVGTAVPEPNLASLMAAAALLGLGLFRHLLPHFRRKPRVYES